MAPDGWVTGPLGRWCEYVRDGDWIETKDQGGDDFRLLQISNIGVGRFVETGNYRWITWETFDRLNCTEVELGDVLVARMPEPTGRAWCAESLPWRAVTAVDVAIVRTIQDELDPRFLAAYLNAPATLALVDSLTTGTTRRRIRRADLEQLHVPVPPIDEQRRIAGVLGALDAKINQNSAVADDARRAGDLRFKVMFGRDDSRARLTDFVSLSKISVSPADQPSDTFEHFSIPAYDDGQLPKAEPGHAILSGKTLVPAAGAILLSKLNPSTPRIWWAKPSGNGIAVCSPEFLVLEPNVAPAFVYAGLRNDSAFYDELLGLATGTTGSRQRVTASQALACSFPSPDLDSLGAYEGFARPLFELDGTLRRASKRLAAVRDTLLPKLVSGKLCVPAGYDPDDVLGTVVEQATGVTL